MTDGIACRMDGILHDMEFWIRKVPNVVQAAMIDPEYPGVIFQCASRRGTSFGHGQTYIAS